MTIAIAVCLQDGALLIADGRQTNPMTPNGKVISDDINKITHISTSISSIVFGITKATNMALSTIRPNIINEARSPVEILQEIKRSVECGWNYLQTTLKQDVNRQHRAMRAGLLVGGYLPIQKQGGFIGGVLRRPNGHDAPTLETKQCSLIVLGGEENNSQEIFKQAFNQEKRTQNDPLKALLRAGVATIRQVEQVNPWVGGVIRYLILRRGFSCSEGILSGEKYGQEN